MTETTTHERRPGAAPSHPARGVRTIVRERFPGRWFVQGVVLVALIQTSACAWLLSRSYFFAEDFTYLQIYHARHVDTELLREPIFGHLIPGFILLNKFFGSTFGADWAAAALLTVVVQL